MMAPSIKKLTSENKFDREYACFWKRGAKKIKRANRKSYRRQLKSEDDTSY